MFNHAKWDADEFTFYLTENYIVFETHLAY